MHVNVYNVPSWFVLGHRVFVLEKGFEHCKSYPVVVVVAVIVVVVVAAAAVAAAVAAVVVVCVTVSIHCIICLRVFQHNLLSAYCDVLH